MISFLALYCLATLDGMFMGYREAAGRHGAIEKRRYYARAMLRGALMVQLAVVFVGGLALLTSWADGRRGHLPYLVGVARFNTFVLPYALVLAVAFRARASSNVDVKSLANVLVFGPFTLLRWPVIVAATVYAALATRWPLSLVYLAMLASMRAVEIALRRRPWLPAP